MKLMGATLDRQTVANELKRGTDIATISRLTGISIKKIKQIEDEDKDQGAKDWDVDVEITYKFDRMISVYAATAAEAGDLARKEAFQLTADHMDIDWNPCEPTSVEVIEVN
jgi:hypothetical protein